MKALVKAVLVLFVIQYLLIPSFNPLLATDKVAVKNQNLTDSHTKPTTSSSASNVENVFRRAISDRIVSVREFNPTSKSLRGLETSEEKHGNLLEYDVSMGSFKVTSLRVAGSEWDIITCNNTSNLNLYGKPAIPYKKTLIPIGDAEVVDVTITQKMTDQILHVKVLPGLKPLPVGSSDADWSSPDSYLEKDFYVDPLIYYSNQEFPSELALHEVVVSKGSRFLALTIFPFRFDPKDNIIRVFDVHVNVELTKPVSTSNHEYASTAFDAENERYVIITPPGLSQAVESFAEWKEQIGFSVQMTSLDEIYSEFSGRDEPEKVRNFIKQSYTANGTQYYLLVGDSNVCPVREVWDPANAGVGLDNGTEPTDLYYECLDGDWDANGNSVFGEMADNVDLYPEVKVGRIPVNTTQDAERVLAMIRKAEESPEPGEWIKKFLLIAPSSFTPGDGASALEEEICQKYLADSFFTTTRLYDVDYSLNPSAVTLAMNGGVRLVDFFDHGAYDQWVGALRTSDVLNLYNGNRTFLAFAMACETAAFDYQQYTTISEAFFRNPNGGAIGYIGATRIAWAGYDCFDGLHHRFWNYFLKNALENMEASPKNALQDALVDMVSTYHAQGPTRETIYQAIYFGDPALNLCWKHNVTTIVTPNLETEQNGTVNGTCSMLLGGKPMTGKYNVSISDPIGKKIVEETGNLGSQGNFTVNFATSSIPGNYTIRTTATSPFSYTDTSTFTVGTLNVTARLNSDPIYGSPIQVSGQVLENGNPIAGTANVSIINEGAIVDSKDVLVDSLGRFQTEMNLTTFGKQAIHVWVSNVTKHGGTQILFKVNRGSILIIADDSGDNPPLYPGGWYDSNKGSSTSYSSFYQALTDEYNVSIYRILYDSVPSLDFLQQYSAVIVTCGDNYGSCLASLQRNLTEVLTQFHNSGGDLLFEGGDIAYSLDHLGYSVFIESVLHAGFFQDLNNNGLYLDNSPHSITHGLPSQILLAKGLGSPSVDLVWPSNGSEKVSGYVGNVNSCASIIAFPSSSELGSVVYFSFSIDGISDTEQRDLLIKNSIQYLLYPTLSVKISDDALLVNTTENILVHVRDSDTKQPLENATVTAEGCGVFAQNETNSNGACSVLIAPTSAGTINVTTQKTGYPNFTSQITVYSIPKLTAQAIPNALKKKTQTVNVKVTDFYEHTDVDSVSVTLSGCGFSETGYTNLTGNAELRVTPTSYGPIRLNASKQGYENYTCLMDVYVNAVVVDSFGTAQPLDSCWDDLNGEWQKYGSVPIRVDIDSLSKYGITYQDLVDSEADVLIISCSAAVGREYTNEEMSAIRRYTLEGHGIISTAGTFYRFVPNNNKLASLFGIREDINYTATYLTDPRLDILDPQHPLFTNIPNPYPVAVGQASCPPDYSWDQDDLMDGTYVAISPQNTSTGMCNESAIVTHNGAVLITHFVEYMSNNYDFQLMYNAIVWSRYNAPEHDLSVFLDVPSYLMPNQTTSIRARVDNVGRNSETNISVRILRNGTGVYSTVIPELQAGYSCEVSCLWTTHAKATYNVTAYVPVLPDENNTLNNRATNFVQVRDPLINPIEGQLARYDTMYFDKNGTMLYTGKINVIYDHYVAPCLINVTIESELIIRDGPIIITINFTYWMLVNTLNRIATASYGGDEFFYPYWIETTIALGSKVNVGTSSVTVVNEQLTRINRRYIDCWVLEPDEVPGYNTTDLYDKASGLWIIGESEVTYGSMFQIDINHIKTVLSETNIQIGFQHDLEASLDAPASFSVRESALITMTVYNLGLVKENEVAFQIRIDNSIVCSGTIPQLDNGSSTTVKYLWKPTNKGTYNVTAYVLPVVGESFTINNIESRIAIVTADDTPPTVSITSPTNGYITNATGTWVNWQGNDNESRISRYYIYLNGELVGNATANVTSQWLPSIVEGSNDIAVVAYDAWGNSASDQITLTVDFTQPTTEIITPTNGTFAKDMVSIIASSYDDHLNYMELYTNGNRTALFNNSGTIVQEWNTTLMADGNYTIALVAYDKAGNRACAQVTVKVDNTPPKAQWTSPPSGSYVSGMATLTFNFSDINLDRAKLEIDGEILADVTDKSFYLLNTTQIADAQHKLTLIVSDKAGNTNATQPITVTVDNTPPMAEILAPKQEEITRGLCIVRFRYFDANLHSVSLKINDTAKDVRGTTEFSFNTTEMTDGNCVVTLTAVDEAGNVASHTLTFKIDNTEPNVTITNSAELTAGESTGVVTLHFSCSDENLETAILCINETTINVTGQLSYQWNTTTVGDGVHVVRLVAYDRAGNMAETPTLSVRTANVQKATKENYSAGWDFGMEIGVALGLIIGLVIGSILFITLKRRTKAPKT
jgi:hypothetical protein